MEDPNGGINQRNPGQGGISKPGSKSPGKDRQGERGNRQPDKPAARPTPSGVPNEGRRLEGERGKQNSSQSNGWQGSRDGQGGMQTPGHGGDQHGGRQESPGSRGQGGIPDPDDVDDGESAGSFRGTAENEDLNSPLRNPE